LGKNCGIKYGAIGNIMGNMLGTSLGTYENMVRTKKSKKFELYTLPPISPLLLKGKRWTHLDAC